MNLGAENGSDQESSRQELRPHRDAARAVPAGDPVARKQLAPARARQGQDVLEVGGRPGEPADRRRTGGTSDRGEQGERNGAAPELEAAGGDVAVRQAVAEQMEQQAGRGGTGP